MHDQSSHPDDHITDFKHNNKQEKFKKTDCLEVHEANEKNNIKDNDAMKSHNNVGLVNVGSDENLELTSNCSKAFKTNLEKNLRERIDAIENYDRHSTSCDYR